MSEMKACKKCSETKDVEHFSKDKAKKDGLNMYCKECMKEKGKIYHEENKEKDKIRHKKYRDANIEKEIMRSKIYHKENKEKETKSNKEYRLKNKNKILNSSKIFREENVEELLKYHEIYREINKDKIAENSRKYYKENLEKRKTDHKLWTQKNSERLSIYKQKHYAKKLLLPSTFTIHQWGNAKQYFNNLCCYCGHKSPLEMEHFIPVTSGGGFTASNIIPACRSCNASKHDKDFFEFYPKYKYYSKERENKILKFLGLNKDERLTSAI